MPSRTAPAASSFATQALSSTAMLSASSRDCAVVRTPATSKMSLRQYGIPCSGPRGPDARDFGFGLLRVAARTLGGDGHEAGEPVVEPFDARQIRLGQLDGRQASLGDQRRGLGDGEEVQVGGHRLSPSAARTLRDRRRAPARHPVSRAAEGELTNRRTCP